MVYPRVTGASWDWILRSADSPQSDGLELGLPVGWHLMPSVGGAVEIVGAHGAVRMLVSRPLARDADGLPVPASYRVRGDVLLVDVPHRSLAVRYPIEVDPNFGQLGFQGNPPTYPEPYGFCGWFSESNDTQILTPQNPLPCSNGPGSYSMSTVAVWDTYPAGAYGAYVFQAPGSGYIFEADFGDLEALLNTDSPPVNTQMFYGIYNSDGSSAGGSYYADPTQPPSGSQPEYISTAGNYYGYRVCTTSTDTGGAPCPMVGNSGNQLAWGLVQQTAGTGDGSVVDAQGIEVDMGDNAPPTAPTTDIPASGTTDRIDASSTDAGLGLSSMSISFPTGGTGPGTSTLSYTFSCETGQAPNTLCPASATVAFGQGLPNGTYSVTVTATAVGGASASTTQTVDFLADATTPPTTPVQVIPVSETRGGGNPDEVHCVQVCTGDPVDTATGDYSESTTDLAIPGRGPGLQLTRTYSSLAAMSGASSALGHGWSFNYGMSLATAPATGNVTITNANGSQTVFTPNGSGGYTAPGRVLASLTVSGGVYTYTVRARTIYTFNSAGQLTSISDLDGDKITLAYNSSNQLATATDGDSRSFTFTYNGSGQLTNVKDSTGRSVSYAYDGNGDLTTVTDVRGGTWVYAYDGNHLLLTRQDARGNVVMTNTYDSSGRVLTSTDGVGNKTTYAYDPGSGYSCQYCVPGTSVNWTDVTDPDGNLTEYVYDGGALMAVQRSQGSGHPVAQWSYERDPTTLAAVAITDPNGHTSYASYDASGNQTSTRSALGHTTASTYDALNDMTSHTDANGVTTTYTYDSKGNLLTKSTPIGSQTQTTTYTYGNTSHPGDVTAITDPDGKKTAYTYDAAGDLATVTDPANDKTSYTYDSLGRRLTMVDPRGYTTSYTYDAAGDELTSTNPLKDETTKTYDADGNLASVTDPDGHKTTYTYDAANELTTTTRPDGTTLKNGYDGDGNLTSQTNGAGHTTTYTYDALGHKTSRTDPLNRTTGYSYDAVGNLLSSTDPLGRTTSYGYDADNELTSITYSDGQTPNVSYTYDNDGRRASMTDGSGTTTYTYDALGRLTQTVDGHGNTTSYGYDLANNLTSITYPNGKAVTRTLDSAERVSTITDWLNNKTTFSYDADSDLTKTAFPHNSDTYTYDNADQLTKVAISASTNASVTYTRDSDGHVLTDTPSGLPGTKQTYTYNTLNQLTAANTSSYAYDPANNPTTLAGASGYTYDAANELTQSPKGSYAYDSLGERTSYTPTSGSATTYSYDQAGRLISATGTSTTNYAYDGDGLRTSKTTGGTTTVYAWDLSGSLPLLLSDGTNSYIYGPDGLPLEQISTSGTVDYYHHDQLGSTRMLTNASGTTVGSFTYDPYGNLTGSTGTTTTPLGYAGQYTDAETGLQYLRARYYDPSTGQFLTLDPMVTVTRQPYAYADDNPIAETDATGNCGLLCIGGIVLGGISLVTGVGEVVGVAVTIGETTVSLGTVSAVAGAAASAADTPGCIQGDMANCVGAGLGIAGAVSSGVAVAGEGLLSDGVETGLNATSVATGTASFGWDLAHAWDGKGGSGADYNGANGPPPGLDCA